MKLHPLTPPDPSHPITLSKRTKRKGSLRTRSAVTQIASATRTHSPNQSLDARGETHTQILRHLTSQISRTSHFTHSNSKVVSYYLSLSPSRTRSLFLCACLFRLSIVASVTVTARTTAPTAAPLQIIVDGSAAR